MKKKHHYIVVDDDSTNNLICDFTIRRFDQHAHIELFTRPEKALLSIEQEYTDTTEAKPTILFLDINMPSMTGWEVLEEFRKLEKEVRDQFTIYMLSSSIEDFSEEAEQYPFVAGFLSKPLKVERLEEISGNM